MSAVFKITYSWQKRREPLPFGEDDYVDASPLSLALQHFLANWEGGFVVQIDDTKLRFDLRPDLSTVFQEIPDVLKKLTLASAAPAELYFFEQGTDLTLLLERRESVIIIQFAKGPSAGNRFSDLPGTRFTAPADLFFIEWIRFAQAVLDHLTGLLPDLVNEESCRDYRASLRALESSVVFRK